MDDIDRDEWDLWKAEVVVLTGLNVTDIIEGYGIANPKAISVWRWRVAVYNIDLKTKRSRDFRMGIHIPEKDLCIETWPRISIVSTNPVNLSWPCDVIWWIDLCQHWLR